MSTIKQHMKKLILKLISEDKYNEYVSYYRESISIRELNECALDKIIYNQLKIQKINKNLNS